MSRKEDKPKSAEPVSGVLRRSAVRFTADDAQMRVPGAAQAPDDGVRAANSGDMENGASGIKYWPGKR